MAFSEQDLSMLLSSATQTYIFNYAFEQKNPGYEFDIQTWTEAVQKLGANGLTVMNAATMEKLQNLMTSLDDFKKLK